MSKGAMIVLGCKHPTGLQLIINFDKDNEEKIVAAGANQGDFRADGLLIPKTVGGFGRTTVSREFWEKWKHQNARIAEEWQAKGFLFVADDPDLALAQAAEKAGASTGFEALKVNAKGELDDARAKAAAPDVTTNPDFAAGRAA